MFVPRYVLAAFALTVLTTLPATAASTFKQDLAASRALPPAPGLTEETLGRRSRLREVKLSPDGTRLAWLEQDGKNFKLMVRQLDRAEQRQLAAGLPRAEIHWSRDGEMLFIDSGDGASVLTLKDGAINKIAAFDNARQQQFLKIDQRRPHSALVDEYDRASTTYRLSRLNADGSREQLYEGARLADFLLDAGGQPSVTRTLDAKFDQVVRYKHGGKWLEAARCKPLQTCSLVAASDDGRFIDMLAPGAGGRASLVRVDSASGKRTMLHSDPARLADLRQVQLSVGAQQPQLALYELPARRVYGLDPASVRAAADIARRFSNSNVNVGLSDGGRWLLTERGARLPQERYWLYDLKARTFEQVLERERALGEPLPEQALAAKIAVDYRASDGATVHGYLSLPPGRDPASLPMVTMVHGGPWAKFDSEYSTLVQLLVNRGFAVFMPNFRSSTGYGDQYTQSPGADFGNGRVQADIIEGVRHLLANGVGDPKRLAIIGDSFGGYATLLALSHTPELFQFGMATTPPTDFGRTMQAAARAPGVDGALPFARYLKEMGVDVDNAAVLQKLAADSPAANVGKVNKPLLIIAGAKDDKVEIAGVTDYVARLQGANRPVSLLVEPDEGHNLRKPLTRQGYVYLLQKMLERHLGGPAVPAPAPELAAFLEKTMKANGALAD